MALNSNVTRRSFVKMAALAGAAAAIGTQMTGCIDSAILIGDKNTLRALARGMASVGIPRSAIRVAADPDAAEDLLDAIAAPGDTVLYEGKIRDW